MEHRHTGSSPGLSVSREKCAEIWTHPYTIYEQYIHPHVGNVHFFFFHFSITKMREEHLQTIFTFRSVRVSCLSGACPPSHTGGERGLQTLLYYILFSMSGWWPWADLIMMLISEWVGRAALKSWLTGEPIYSQSTQSTPYPLLIRQEYLGFNNFLTLYQTHMLTGVRSEGLLPRYSVC